MIKSIGVRKVDSLGRVTLPVSARRPSEIRQQDSVEFFVEGESLIVKKFKIKCVFCGSELDTGLFKEKVVCKKCSSELINIKY